MSPAGGIHVFAKSHGALDAPALAGLARRCGADGIAAVVREGFAVAPGNLAALPGFAQSLRAAGVRVDYCIAAPFTAGGIAADDALLAACADAGIPRVRIGYFDAGSDPAAAMRRARADLARLAEVCLRRRVQAVLQLHHGRLVASPSAAWYALDGLPPEAVGVKLDPGNQAWEGLEAWPKAIALLRPWLAALGVKDVLWERVPRSASEARDQHRSSWDDGSPRWRQRWCELSEGVTDWPTLLRALASVGFAGPYVVHPFYHDRDLPAQEAALARDIAWLRRAITASARA